MRAVIDLLVIAQRPHWCRLRSGALQHFETAFKVQSPRYGRRGLAVSSVVSWLGGSPCPESQGGPADLTLGCMVAQLAILFVRATPLDCLFAARKAAPVAGGGRARWRQPERQPFLRSGVGGNCAHKGRGAQGYVSPAIYVRGRVRFIRTTLSPDDDQAISAARDRR